MFNSKTSPLSTTHTHRLTQTTITISSQSCQCRAHCFVLISSYCIQINLHERLCFVCTSDGTVWLTPARLNKSVMKHYRLYLKVAFKQHVMLQQGPLGHICGNPKAPFVISISDAASTLLSLFLIFFSYPQSPSYISIWLYSQDHKILIVSVIFFMSNMFNGAIVRQYESQWGSYERGWPVC